MIQAAVLFFTICISNYLFIDFLSSPVIDDVLPIGGSYRVSQIFEMFGIALVSSIVCHVLFFSEKQAKKVFVGMLCLALVGISTSGQSFFLISYLQDGHIEPLSTSEFFAQTGVIMVYGLSLAIRVFKLPFFIFAAIMPIIGILSTIHFKWDSLVVWCLVFATYGFLYTCKLEGKSNDTTKEPI